MERLRRAAPSSAGSRFRRPLNGIAIALETALGLSVAYLLGLLVAARNEMRRKLAPVTAAGSDRRLRLVVLVPAHDEEAGIGATLRSLTACDYPTEARQIVVVADNCTDRTATVAAGAGAEVWERVEPDKRGKGFALAWALDRLLAQGDAFDAAVMVDADCTVSSNLLAAVDRRLQAGAEGLQVDYVAANPEASSTSALRFAAFAVGDTVRFLGKQRLGLSSGLVGTGMAFTAVLLRRVPWTATGLTEDSEYHMRLVFAGVRTEFVSDAWVSQAVPVSPEASGSQQARWELGKLQLIRRWSLPMLRAGLARRDAVCVHAGLECFVPPQSLLAVGNLGSAFVGVLTGSRRLLGLSLLALTGQLGFVLAGLRLVGAPACVYRALLTAPVLILAKLRLYGRLVTGHGPTSWVRTAREAPHRPRPVELELSR